jgi:hypothetical protein
MKVWLGQSELFVVLEAFTERGDKWAGKSPKNTCSAEEKLSMPTYTAGKGVVRVAT